MTIFDPKTLRRPVLQSAHGHVPSALWPSSNANQANVFFPVNPATTNCVRSKCPPTSYSCNDCGERLEVVQSIPTMIPRTTCPNCGAHCANTSATEIVFKEAVRILPLAARQRRRHRRRPPEQARAQAADAGSNRAQRQRRLPRRPIPQRRPPRILRSSGTSDSSSATT